MGEAINPRKTTKIGYVLKAFAVLFAIPAVLVAMSVYNMPTVDGMAHAMKFLIVAGIGLCSGFVCALLWAAGTVVDLLDAIRHAVAPGWKVEDTFGDNPNEHLPWVKNR